MKNIIKPTTNKFRYHDELEEITIPYLFLGWEVSHGQGDVPEPMTNWKIKPHYLKVQCGGYACNYKEFEGIIFNLPHLKEKIQKISNKYLESCFTTYQLSVLDHYIIYDKFLKKILDVRANRCFERLVEAIYPIDMNYLEKLTGYQYENLVKEIIDYPDGKEFLDMSAQLELDRSVGLYILGENCD